jgi:hypothetical protein
VDLDQQALGVARQLLGLLLVERLIAERGLREQRPDLGGQRVTTRGEGLDLAR